MVFELFRGSGGDQIESIEQRIGGMLADCGAEFDMAMAAVMGDASAADMGKRLRKRDREVNRAERAIRRELVVIAGVRGSGAEVPLILVYMSIIKDIERVGDYAKNIWDIADAGVSLSDASDRREIEAHVEEIRQLIRETARIFGERDSEAARQVLPETDALLDVFDELVVTQIRSNAPSHFGVPRALLYRYFKRIVAHLMNVITSVVMPLDHLDYWDEDKADRLAVEDSDI